MKIISKFKDYYDYLQGVFGVDEKLVLDRTKFHKPFLSNYDKIILVIGNLVVEGLYVDDTFVYGDDLKKYEHKHEAFRWGKGRTYSYIDKKEDYYYINVPKEISLRGGLNILKEKCTREEYFKNDKTREKLEKYPLFLFKGTEVYEYPILKDYILGSFISPEEVWFSLSDWLSKDVKIEDNRTDKEKIVGKGFDYKTSFRKM